MKTSTWEQGIGVGAIAVVAAFAPPLWAFDAFEHRHLGNVAYERAKGASEKSLPQQAIKDLDEFMKELDKFNENTKVDEKPCVPSNQIKPSHCVESFRDENEDSVWA